MGFRVLAWVLGLSCFACGGDDASSAPPADAGTDQMGGTGAGGSGGNSGSAGSGGNAGGGSGGTSAGAGGTSGGGAGGGAGQTVGDGYVFIQQSASQHQLLATFDVWTPMPLCTYREVGACRLDLCTPPTAHASAGQVGASVGTVTRTATGADAGANQGTWPGQLWQPGETVRLFATGAEVPAFDETVPGPAPFTLIEPAPSTMIGVSRAQPLRVRWSGGDFGSAVVALVGMSVSARTPLQVKCSFNAALGEGAVPVEALTDLDPAAQRTTLVAFAEGYKRLDRGGWLLRVGARTTSISATVVLQ
jgi:hypothetical protein